MNYLEVANSNLMFFMCTLVIAFVLLQAVLFIKAAWKRGAEMGIEPAVMKKAMTNAGLFSVIPSLPIVVMLVVLTVNLGQYFPWLRLSVVGSATYENMAADIVAKASGLAGIADPRFDLQIFTMAMWVMSIGIIWGIVFNIFFMKSLDKFSKKAKASNSHFIPVLSGALFIGMLALMSAPYITDTKNTTAIVSFISAAVAVILCGKVAKASGVKAIDEFSLPISLIVGMASAIVYTNTF
ncbi:MAG: DUF5058 family protein [Synergistaceae bacterium]|nr:DUF5058 family protein [Synergistaceae bacterium]